ncbi:MAG: hypothetical protein AABY07_09460 [Nanoarchaeota archaeon]
MFEWHKYPINAALHAVALIVLIIALWNRSWMWIVIAIIVAAIGHLIQETYGHKARISKLEGKKRK